MHDEQNSSTNNHSTPELNTAGTETLDVPSEGSVQRGIPDWLQSEEHLPGLKDYGSRHNARRDSNRRRYAWRQAQRRAAALIAAAEPQLRSFRSVLGAPAEIVEPPLAALIVACDAAFKNSAPHTLAAAVTGLSGDTRADSEVVRADGEVRPGTLAYQILAPLADYEDAGVGEPRAAIDTWIDSERHATITEALTTAVVGRGSNYASGNNHEHSALNFTVPVVPPSGRSLDEIRADLDRRPGLAGIKDVVEQFAATEQINVLRRDAGLKTDASVRHMVFTGNPGTGKTTVARMVAEILDATGSMPGAHLVEADRSMLVGEWLGTSALKTRKVAEAAYGGVLFVDEAYSLAGTGEGNQSADRFAHEALATLVKVMEDDRDALVVILAGYPEGMANLLAMNQGLASRVGMHVHFPDFSDSELLEIFHLMAVESDYQLACDADAPMRSVLASARTQPGFGNARWVRSVFEATCTAHAVRLSKALDAGNRVDSELSTLRLGDVAQAVRIRH